MTVPPDPAKVAHLWIEKAEHDLITAEHTLTLGNTCPFDMVCFHAQQCAEKYLKAALAVYGAEVPRTHDLVILKQRLTAISGAGFAVAGLQMLNRYSVETRYPGEWEPITRDEAAGAIATAKCVKSAIAALLSRSNPSLFGKSEE